MGVGLFPTVRMHLQNKLNIEMLKLVKFSWLRIWESQSETQMEWACQGPDEIGTPNWQVMPIHCPAG